MIRISWLNIFSNPLVMGLILFLVFFYFFQSIFPPYKLRVTGWEPHPPYEVVIFQDMNRDGISEEILFDFLRDDFYTIMVSQEGKILNHFKGDGRLLFNEHTCFGDVNGNNLEEIYLISMVGDSIMLAWLEPHDSMPVVRYKAMEKAMKIGGDLTTGIIHPRIADVDGDGTKEFLCIINTGYGVFPRCMLMYDFDNDIIRKSPASCAALNDYELFDLNGDGIMEIVITANRALGNCMNDSIPNDQHTWIMVLDHKLDWFFQPVQVGAYPSVLEMTVVDDGEIHLLAANYYRGMSDGESMLIRADIHGRILSTRTIKQPGHKSKIRLFRMMEYEHPLCLENSGKVSLIGPDLIPADLAQMDAQYNETLIYEDLDGNGSMELLLVPLTKKGFYIVDAGFVKKAEAEDIDINLKDYFSFSLIKHTDRHRQFALYTFHDGLFTMEYFKNPLYFLKYIFYVLIYAGFVTLIFFIGRIQKARFRMEYARKRRMAELQLIAIQKQISPHFTLNILNSIGTLMYRNDIGKVQSLLGKYSKILRYSLVNSDVISVSLSEELEQIRNYLYLEQFRMDGVFNYDIFLDERVDMELRIPKTLLFTFIENAVKHGIRPLQETGGMIRLKIRPNGKQYIIRITDNGIGRENAAALPSLSTGKGLKILDEIIRIYFDLEKVRIRYWIEDLNPESDNPGTKVKIIIPMRY